jgi:methanogenic corrinoid protein MtbC1
VERLRLLHRLTERGHSIGRLANTSLADLERMVGEEDVASDAAPAIGSRPEDFRLAAVNAARRLDGAELQAVLERAAVTLGVPGFLDEVAGVSLQRIGQGWNEGTLSVAHEHLATAVFRRVLGWILRVYEVNGAGRRMVVATPPRQAHELGALLAAATAAAEGWAVTYLGADLPIRDILTSARQVGAAAVALSIVYPAIDSGVVTDLQQLRSGLERGVGILIGGAAASAEAERLTAPGVEVVNSLAQFRTALQRFQEQR